MTFLLGRLFRPVHHAHST